MDYLTVTTTNLQPVFSSFILNFLNINLLVLPQMLNALTPLLPNTNLFFPCSALCIILFIHFLVSPLFSAICNSYCTPT